MATLANEVAPVYTGLRDVGYAEDHLVANFPISSPGSAVPLMGFADRPFDSRTASVAVIEAKKVEPSDIASLLPLGAPIIFACLPQRYEFWSQGASRPIFRQYIRPQQLTEFFRSNREKLTPDAVYRAKVWGRLDKEYQLEFVDAGLMPVVEEAAGRKLTDLVESVVKDAKKQLGWENVTVADGRWLLQAIFWLLAAKILQDKQVSHFRRLDLTDIEEVYRKLAEHYNSKSPRPLPVANKKRRETLVAAAERIQRFGHCGCVSTEALAYLYESALIDRVTRSKLGTHSTPTWLVDYIVGRLRPWISEIAVADRRVFEPACGHAAFLISAMRLLTELLPPDWRESRRDYLRRRLHGLEVDPFALEIARLSLTLADVPNPNGWALTESDMFARTTLEEGVRKATIVLANPPFENFKADKRDSTWLVNKAAETFRRVVEQLPQGGVFGFVLPQTILRSQEATDVRRMLLREYEIAEIDLFADKVFRYGESESAAIIGRRLRPANNSAVRFRRVRERHVEEFKHSYNAGSVEEVPFEDFAATPSASLLWPDLAGVWNALSNMPKLNAFAEIGKGFEHRSESDPLRPKNSITVSEVRVEGMDVGFAHWRKKQMTHLLPKVAYLNLDPSMIRRPGLGVSGDKPQLLLNCARVSREPWKLEALIDRRGYPATSSFNIVRPTIAGLGLNVFWSILNSPIANAFVYCMCDKRNIPPHIIRELPVPSLPDVDLIALEAAVVDYWKAVESLSADPNRTVQKPPTRRNSRQTEMFDDDAEVTKPSVSADDLKMLCWRIDAEVLRLYNLPSALERQLLDLFCGIRRRGVPFEQDEYFPREFTDLERLQDFLAITADWPRTNRRRTRLIDREAEGKLTPSQQTELVELQRLADARVSLLRPVHIEGADRIIEDLKRAGQWEEQT